MKSTLFLLFFALLAGPLLSPAESSSSLSDPSAVGSASSAGAAKRAKNPEVPLKPFSRLALGGGVSVMGINLQAATNVNRYMNLRAAGNVFSYSANNISTNGFSGGAKLNFATMGASLDFYPFPTHGFRVSPGALFYNQNELNANVTVAGGQSFTLNGEDYYSSTANPVQGTGFVGLNSTNPAFTLTTGWGNMISRRDRHLSFPFEVGAAFVGSPAVKVNLTSGQVCNSGGATGCQNVVGDTSLNTQLQAQIAKYQSDLNPLKVFPIFSVGVTYDFHLK